MAHGAIRNLLSLHHNLPEPNTSHKILTNRKKFLYCFHVQERASLSCLKTLAARWRLLGVMAVQLARRMLHLERAGAREAYAYAEALESVSVTALAELTEQISDFDRRGPSLTPEVRRDRAFLLVSFAVFSNLLLMAQRVKHRLARAPKNRDHSAALLIPYETHRSAAQAPDYLDSS